MQKERYDFFNFSGILELERMEMGGSLKLVGGGMPGNWRTMACCGEGVFKKLSMFKQYPKRTGAKWGGKGERWSMKGPFSVKV